MGPPKSCQEKILSNFAYTGTTKACQGKLVKENLFVVQTRKCTCQETCQGKLARLYGALGDNISRSKTDIKILQKIFRYF